MPSPSGVDGKINCRYLQLLPQLPSPHIPYYAHPYCASERGSNKNANRLIRRFLPKGTDFPSLSQRDMDCLAYWMNCYPRKILDGKAARHIARQFSFHSTPLPS